MKTLFKQYGFLFLFSLLVVSCTPYRIAQSEVQTLRTLDYPEESHSESITSLEYKQFSNSIYVVHAGNFRDITYAQDLRRELELKGFNAYITLSGIYENKRHYNVYIGRFIDRQQAEKLSEKIKKTANLQIFVTLKPPEGKFAVQAGAFRNITYALAQRKRLEEKGYNAYIMLLLSDKNEKLYKVLIGEFLEKEHAERLSEDIKKINDIDVFVTII